MRRLILAVTGMSMAATAAAAQSAGAMPAAPAIPVSAAETIPVSASPTITPPPGSPGVVASGDILQTLRASGQFTLLLQGLRQTNLIGVLRTNSNLTLLAPTDAAFRALPPAQLRALMATGNAATFQRLLTYHLINARVDGADIHGAAGRARSVEGEDLHIDGVGLTPRVEDANIIQSGVMASNGVIHVIDKVLVPRSLAASAIFAPASVPTGTSADAAATRITSPAPTQPTATLGH